MTSTPEPTLRSPAPEFSLPASNGKTISLADFRSHQHVYLFFVREYI